MGGARGQAHRVPYHRRHPGAVGSTKLGFTSSWRPHPSRRAITCSRTVPGAPAIKGNRRRCRVVDRGTRPARRAGEQTAMGGTWLRFLRSSGTACAVVTAAALAAASTACSAGPAPGREAEHGPRRAALTTTFQLPGVAGVATGDGAAWVTTGNAVLRINLRYRPSQPVSRRPGRVPDRRCLRGGQPVGRGQRWHSAGGSAHRQGHGQDRGPCLRAIPSAKKGAVGAEIPGARATGPDRPGDERRACFPPPVAGQALGWRPARVRSGSRRPARRSGACCASTRATGRVAARIPGSHLFGHVAVGDGAVWASDGAAVTRIDPRTDQVTATATLSPPVAPGSSIPDGSGLLGAAPGTVWVTGSGDGRQVNVLRIDPRTGQITGRRGGRPRAAGGCRVGSTVWVATATGLARADLVTCVHGQCARPALAASLPAAPVPVWLDSLQMVSARDGWALAWTSNPASPLPAGLIPVRTTDGGRTWTAVTPAQARRLLVRDQAGRSCTPCPRAGRGSQ